MLTVERRLQPLERKALAGALRAHQHGKVAEFEVLSRPSDVGTDVAIAFAEAAWAAIAAADPEQRIAKRAITLNMWGRVTSQTFAELAGNFVAPLEESAYASSIAWRTADFAFAIEEAGDDPAGLFVRAVTVVQGDASLQALAAPFKSRVRALLALVGVEAPGSLQ